MQKKQVAQQVPSACLQVLQVEITSILTIMLGLDR